MFPTFTGSARRPRNVNMSGQKSFNPFTGSSWSPGASALGATKTVAQAQAERAQRQQERERLKAAQRIQRTWRGHRARRELRASRRQALDRLYADAALVDLEGRTAKATPLLLGVYQATNAQDQHRLCWLASDLLASKFACVASGAIELPRLQRLAQIVVSSLEWHETSKQDPVESIAQIQILLDTLIQIVTLRPQSVQAVLGRLYKVLAGYCRGLGPSSPLLDRVCHAVTAPLSAASVPCDFTRSAYVEFAQSFLAQADLFLFESNIGAFAADMDVDQLSDALATGDIVSSVSSASPSRLMWLLAHFIALQKKKKGVALHARSLKALYSLLSTLSTPIRAAFSVPNLKASGETETLEEPSRPSLAPYVSDQLSSLTNRDEISGLLGQFISEHGGTSASDLEYAGFLAGYILTLVNCFPALSDDIRMRLYLADIPTTTAPLPAVKFFWNAFSQTSIFSSIVQDADAALPILRQKPPSETDSAWHREWRTILLFLELYVFVLRLTDDEDFFSGLAMNILNASSTSRLRSCSLGANNLAQLATFLKHLGFTLYYHAADLLGSAHEPLQAAQTSPSSSSPSASRALGGSAAASSLAFSVTAGVDFEAFRSLISTAMKMLYERDSRRRFLPHDHWLMTSKLDMDGFLSAVVLEEQNQREREEAEGRDSDDESSDGETAATSLRMTMTASGLRLSRQAQAERILMARKRARKQLLRAAAGPRLEILRNMPFVIPFDMRVQIFRQFVYLDKHRRRGGNIDPDRWRLWVLNQHGGPFDPSPAAHNVLSRHQAKIQRGHIFQDAVEAFWSLDDKLKEPIQITFVDEFGMPEAGIDGGGVTKEFLISVTSEAFRPEERLFVSNSKNSYYPNPCDLDQVKNALREAGIREGSEVWNETIASRLRQYEFLGRIIGKCLYEGILIDIAFAGFFLLKWASAGAPDAYRANINDLRELDEELYQGMLRLKNYPGDVGDLALDFTITDQVSLPGEPVKTVTRGLVPDGENLAVTNENRPLYISYVARHRLVVQPYAQTRAFLRGLGLIIDPAWLSMFNQNELQRLAGGDSSEIDVEDLRRHTVYSGVYALGDDGEEHPTVQLFWEVMRGLDDRQRRDVLKYVTSTPRAPLLGFGQLSPPFSIRDGGRDQDRLPSASTCVNLLKLPQYQSKEVLKEKLLYAVTSGAGFDLS
ncbi:hypothetical protein VTJ83DRAFT_5424 [Remersonia thermophila]|uniref:HECT-type E3 ubiquitin transferase n=1 Tax=Remersonia thermophila TaxID=72144 RepID=A0ABR4D903_9PEZI